MDRRSVVLRLARSVIVIALSVAVVVVLAAWLLAETLLFAPAPQSYALPYPGITTLARDDGEPIAVTWLPNPESAWTVLYSHGNGEDLAQIMPRLHAIRDAGWSVLAYDYPGYGASPGPASVAAMQSAITAVWHHALTDLKLPAERVILHGRSLGSAPSLWLAGRVACGGVIVESGFHNAIPVAMRVDVLWWDPLPNGRYIAAVDEPIAILHSVDDRLILPGHAKANAAAAEARGPTMTIWLEGPGHNDTVIHDPRAYFDALTAIRQFMHDAHDHEPRDAGHDQLASEPDH